MTKLSELIYNAWENPSIENIELEVENIIDGSQLSKEDADLLVNKIYNITDHHECDSREWIENVNKLAEEVDEIA